MALVAHSRSGASYDLGWERCPYTGGAANASMNSIAILS